MSGYKRATVNIGQEEYDRLREAEVRLRALPEISAPAQQQIQHKLLEGMENDMRGLLDRQGRYEHMLAGMQDTVRDLESSTVQALVSYDSAMRADLQQYAGTLWTHFDQMVSEQGRRFDAEVAEMHHQFQQELAVMSRRMRKMAGDADRKREIAAGWLAAAENLAGFIGQNYPIDTYFPERFDRLVMQLEQARLNYEIGLPEAVVVASQQLYCAFSDLRLDLEKAEQEWQLLYHATQEAVEQLMAQVLESQQVEAIDLDGQPLPYTVDLTYWVPGRLDQLYSQLYDLADQLAQRPRDYDTHTLRVYLSEDLPHLQQLLEESVLDGRVQALNSQLRINIADMVVQALQDQGFRLAEAEYETEDMREAFDARLMNLDGSEVLVTVAPSGQFLGDNELRLESFDQEDRTEHELQQRWLEISQSLHHYGLEVGSVMTEERSRPTTTGRRSEQGGQNRGYARSSAPVAASQQRGENYRPHGNRANPASLP